MLSLACLWGEELAALYLQINPTALPSKVGDPSNQTGELIYLVGHQHVASWHAQGLHVADLYCIFVHM